MSASTACLTPAPVTPGPSLRAVEPAAAGAGQTCPFDLADDAGYARWRAWKLAHRPRGIEDLLVDVADPRALQPAERAALLQRIERCSVAIYRSPVTAADKALPRALGAQLGLRQLDANWLADEDGISCIAVAGGAPADAGAGAGEARSAYIPYTDRAIRWHTDGYYHPAGRRIRAMILHCVRPARQGGVNGLLDHEMAYLRLRDLSPAHIEALMQPDVMVVPARTDDEGVARPAQGGPVFAVDADGSLHMRYTARTRSIEWKGDARTRAAVAALQAVLAPGSPDVLQLQLRPGMGIAGHNLLHERSAFEDDPARPRLLYRARFTDRVALPEGAPWRNG